MEQRTAYCSARDVNVPVLVRRGATAAGKLTVVHDDTLVCLAYGVSCTGAFCPMFTTEDGAAAGAAVSVTAPVA